MRTNKIGRKAKETGMKTKLRMLQNKAFLPYCFHSAKRTRPEFRKLLTS